MSGSNELDFTLGADVQVRALLAGTKRVVSTDLLKGFVASYPDCRLLVFATDSYFDKDARGYAKRQSEPGLVLVDNLDMGKLQCRIPPNAPERAPIRVGSAEEPPKQRLADLWPYSLSSGRIHDAQDARGARGSRTRCCAEVSEKREARGDVRCDAMPAETSASVMTPPKAKNALDAGPCNDLSEQSEEKASIESVVAKRAAKQLEGCFSDDFYQLAEFKTIVKRKLADTKLSSKQFSEVVQMLGFKLRAGYVLKQAWPNLNTYIETLILKADFFSMGDLPKKTRDLKQLSNAMTALRRSARLLPYDEGSWITEKGLASLDITAPVLESFALQAHSYALGQGLEVCTAYSLRNHGFQHRLFKYEFIDALYDTVLSSALSPFHALHLGNMQKVLFATEEKPALSKMVAYLLKDVGSMYIYDLIAMGRDSLGISLVEGSLKLMPNSSTLYYNPIMEKIYLTKDLFIEELKRS